MSLILSYLLKFVKIDVFWDIDIDATLDFLEEFIFEDLDLKD